MYDKITNEVIANEVNSKKRGGGIANEIADFEQFLALENFNSALEEFERIYLKCQLERNDNNITNLSKNIGLDRSTVYKKIRKYNLKKL
jgi:two-component system nitrogen regulation response regulator NtrX